MFRGWMMENEKALTLLGYEIDKEFSAAGADKAAHKAYRRLWLLRKARSLTDNVTMLQAVFSGYIRSVMELYLPLWYANMNDGRWRKAEKVVRIALRIMEARSDTPLRLRWERRMAVFMWKVLRSGKFQDNWKDIDKARLGRRRPYLFVMPRW